MERALAFLFLLAGCSGGDEGEPQPPADSPYEWQCIDKTVVRGPFCDCQRGEHGLQSSQKTCGEAPCCYSGSHADGTDECICHSQEFQETDGRTCEETVVLASRAAASPFRQVTACPPDS